MTMAARVSRERVWMGGMGRGKEQPMPTGNPSPSLSMDEEKGPPWPAMTGETPRPSSPQSPEANGTRKDGNAPGLDGKSRGRDRALLFGAPLSCTHRRTRS